MSQTIVKPSLVGLSKDIQQRIELIVLLDKAHQQLLATYPVDVCAALELAKECRNAHLRQKARQVLALIPHDKQRKKSAKPSLKNRKSRNS